MATLPNLEEYFASAPNFQVMKRRDRARVCQELRGIGLTPKQLAFLLEYYKEFNGVQAAKKAGYAGSYNVLAVTAHDNLKKPKIKEALELLDSYYYDPATEHHILRKLDWILSADIYDVLDFDMGKLFLKPGATLTKEQRASIKSLEITETKWGERMKVTLHDPLRASEIFAKIRGMMLDKPQEKETHEDAELYDVFA